jgi:hypothetical protein
MRLNPCHACPLRKGCENLDQLKKKASGTGARSISYDCAKLDKEMRIGRRILIETVILTPTDNPYYGGDVYDRSRRNVKATITARSGYYRFACIVDPGQITEEDVAEGVDTNKIRFRKTMRHTRIMGFMDEPDAEISMCGNVKRDGKCERQDGRECDCYQFTDGSVDHMNFFA